MYRMTYNNKGVSGCSARGIAKRETVDELIKLAETLKDSICNVEIKPMLLIDEKNMPMKIELNMKSDQ